MTAANQIGDGLLSVKERGTVVSATVYQLNTEKLYHSLRTLNVRKWLTLSNVADHDAFRNGGGRYAKGRLGRRAGDVYALLLQEPLTVEEIAKQIGAHKKTVKRAIDKLRNVIDYQTGELIEMVLNEGGVWYANHEVNLDQIAALKRTYGATGKQRIDYERERRAHARSLELGMLSKGDRIRA